MLSQIPPVILSPLGLSPVLLVRENARNLRQGIACFAHSIPHETKDSPQFLNKVYHIYVMIASLAKSVTSHNNVFPTSALRGNAHIDSGDAGNT